MDDSLISSGQTINQKKVKNPEIRFNSQQTISYYLGLRTKDPGLRQVDLKAGPKRVSDKINMPKLGGKTAEEMKPCRTASTHKWIPAVREVDMKPSAKRGANRNEALVSLYCSYRSLHPKQPPNQISHKSTKIDPIRLSRT